MITESRTRPSIHECEPYSVAGSRQGHGSLAQRSGSKECTQWEHRCEARQAALEVAWEGPCGCRWSVGDAGGRDSAGTWERGGGGSCRAAVGEQREWPQTPLQGTFTVSGFSNLVKGSACKEQGDTPPLTDYKGCWETGSLDVGIFQASSSYVLKQLIKVGQVSPKGGWTLGTLNLHLFFLLRATGKGHRGARQRRYRASAQAPGGAREGRCAQLQGFPAGPTHSVRHAPC